MANMKLDPKWLLELTQPEMRLILRALGGRIKTDAELQEAKDLGDDLFKQRGVQAKGWVTTLAIPKEFGVDEDMNDTHQT